MFSCPSDPFNLFSQVVIDVFPISFSSINWWLKSDVELLMLNVILTFRDWEVSPCKI